MNSIFNTASIKDEVKIFREKYNKKFLFWLYKQYPELKREVLTFAYTNKLQEIKNGSQLLFHYVNNLTEQPKCETCGAVVNTFGVNGKWDYNNFCSKKCVGKNAELIKKRSSTRSGKKFSVSEKLKDLQEAALAASYDKNDIDDLKNFLKTQNSISNKKVLFLHKHPKWFRIVYERGESNFEEGVYLIFNDAEKPNCRKCFSPLQFKSVQNGYDEICNNKSCHKAQKRNHIINNKTLLNLDELRKRLKDVISSFSKSSVYQSLNKKDPNLCLNVFDYTKFLSKECKFNERLYCVLNSIAERPLCVVCKQAPVKFLTLQKGYNECCSIKCRIKLIGDSRNEKSTKTIRAKNYEIWSDRFEYKNEIILTEKQTFIDTGKLSFKCKSCENVYEREKHFNVKCPQCLKLSVSSPEIEIRNFLTNECGTEITTNSKKIIPPLELDVFIPSKNVAIEYNGLFWHSEDRIGKKYHLEKTLACEKRGIQLIHIFENEWLQNPNLVKSIIKNKIGVVNHKIWARECTLKEVDVKTKNEFLINNHIQGADNSSVCLGLFHEETLVSLMTFGKRQITKAKPMLEMIRFCCIRDTIVVGGASKLFSFFVKNYKPEKILSYANRRYSLGKLYEKLGFKLQNISPPNYWYFNSDGCRLGILHHRSKFQRHMLSKIFKKEFDKNLTERDIMREEGYTRIWDCGNYVFQWTLEAKN